MSSLVGAGPSPSLPTVVLRAASNSAESQAGADRGVQNVGAVERAILAGDAEELRRLIIDLKFNVSDRAWDAAHDQHDDAVMSVLSMYCNLTDVEIREEGPPVPTEARRQRSDDLARRGQLGFLRSISADSRADDYEGLDWDEYDEYGDFAPSAGGAGGGGGSRRQNNRGGYRAMYSSKHVRVQGMQAAASEQKARNKGPVSSGGKKAKGKKKKKSGKKHRGNKR